MRGAKARRAFYGPRDPCQQEPGVNPLGARGSSGWLPGRPEFRTPISFEIGACYLIIAPQIAQPSKLGPGRPECSMGQYPPAQIY